MSTDDINELNSKGDERKLDASDEGAHKDQHEAFHVIHVHSLRAVKHVPVLVGKFLAVSSTASVRIT